ncbi:aldolase [Caldalkalibacillus thermarum]|uniref:class II aldolase/adducin family protein n=1 Tax=Caldalkalibacillus thermarum TaxID=296745 RepID=UPI00166D917C|nr:class II aldolase/adducin family protein [Caldalkalibacillus thermarum]GGK14409.1 aldolase [Caldalkalibacillus thermarum]
MKNFSIVGTYRSPFMDWFIRGIKAQFINKGYTYMDLPLGDIKLVFNLVEPERPRPFRRQAQATFVVSIIEREIQNEEDHPENMFKVAYPYLIRTLANHLLCIVRSKDRSTIYFITPEQGCYRLPYSFGEEEQLFEAVYQRLEPLASSNLVIDNYFEPDLPQELWDGDGITQQMYRAGQRLDELNLLPAPFPIKEYLSERDLRHLHKLYGIGGLSYGNLSSRRDAHTFWMSASGVNKSKLKTIGQDILLIKDYDHDRNGMRISVPPHVQPKRASVDAIEHWMIYRQHPGVGAIVHIHAWMDGVKETEINYPCGTIELAKTVAQLVSESENPAQTVIGLKNHGLTITGRDLDDIFDRIEGRIIPQVPMT